MGKSLSIKKKGVATGKLAGHDLDSNIADVDTGGAVVLTDRGVIQQFWLLFWVFTLNAS